MLRSKLLLILALATIVYGGVPDCSKGCTCTNTTAVCNTINFENFGRKIHNLKIVNPNLPLILKNDTFDIGGLQDIKSIKIENATILGIDKSAFDRISSLFVLSIVNSKIPSIHNPHAFATRGIKKLQIVNSTLHSFQHVKSRYMEELDLSGCMLQEISVNSFSGLPELSYLNLANNQIKKIHPSAFSNLSFLQEINLSNNNISHLDDNIFKSNEELVTIDLSNNPLSNLNLKLTSELESLDLRSLKLETLNQNLTSNLVYLSYLDLSNNSIVFPKNIFNVMHFLEVINLSNNNLKSLDSEIFIINDELNKIVLDNNNFTVLPKFVANFSVFETYIFSCKNCNLVSIPEDAFVHFKPLSILNLSKNRLSGINLNALQHLSSLVELDLSYNNIGVINPLTFVNSTRLEKLYLAGNPLISLDAMLFYNNAVLTTLDVSYCNLKQLWIQPKSKYVTSLRALILTNNSISSISPTDLQVTPYLKILDITNNSLKCDENLRDSINWLNKREVTWSSKTWKMPRATHEINSDVLVFEDVSDYNWNNLAKTKCSKQFYRKNFEEIIEPEIPPSVKNIIEEETEISILTPAKDLHNKLPSPILNVDNILSDDSYEEYDDEFYSEPEYIKPIDAIGKVTNHDETEIDLDDLALETIHFRTEKRSHYSILWPTLVFIFTALTVLVIAANVLLLMVRSRMLPRQVNLPHIKIPQWSTNGKLKKHSGSVYQPLSEERSEVATPIVIRKDHVPTHHFLIKTQK